MFEFRALSSAPPSAQDTEPQSKADAAHIEGAEATLLNVVRNPGATTPAQNRPTAGGVDPRTRFAEVFQVYRVVA